MKKNAFTLIELLVTISIIAILSGISFTTYKDVTLKAKNVARKNDLNKIATALEIYSQQNGGRYISGFTNCIIDPNDPKVKDFNSKLGTYLSSPLTDPSNNQAYCYISPPDGKSYRLYTHLDKCTDSGGNLCGNTTYNYSLISSNLPSASSAPGDQPLPKPQPTPVPTPNPSSGPLSGKLAFASPQPIKGGQGFAFGFQPIVEVKDNAGVKNTSDNSTVVTLQITPGSGTFAAGLNCNSSTKTVSSGVAAFSGCFIDLTNPTGQGYSLQALAPNFTPATLSPSFNINWPGDASGDNKVDILDFSIFLSNFGKSSSSPNFDTRADFNGDNKVDILDFSIILAMFGTRQPSLTINPATGGPGTIVTVNGSSYGGGQAIKVNFGSLVVSSSDLKTDGFGAFTTNFTIPDGISRGIYQVNAGYGRVVTGVGFSVP